MPAAKRILLTFDLVSVWDSSCLGALQLFVVRVAFAVLVHSLQTLAPESERSGRGGKKVTTLGGDFLLGSCAMRSRFWLTVALSIALSLPGPPNHLSKVLSFLP